MSQKKVNVLVELNFKQDEKVKISPVGSFVGVDGRSFLVDKESINKTRANKIDLVVNENHGYSESRDKATGWIDINSLEVREDGVYASINLTKLGEGLVKDKLYRYLSPEYVMDRNSTDRRVLYICGLGLVNSPNLLDKALNNKAKEEEEYLNQEKLKELEDELNLIKEQIANLTKELAKERELNHSLNVDLALERNQILPVQREFCKELNSSQLTKFIESNSVNIEELTKEIDISKGSGKRELNSTEKNMCKQLGISEEEYLNGNS